MHDQPNQFPTDNALSPTEIAAASIAPSWHGMTAPSMELRSLMHDVESSAEHSHEAAELILNLGSVFGSVMWRDTEGTEKTIRIGSDQCCLIPAGVTHLVDGLRSHGVVSLLIGGALLAEMGRMNVKEVIVESLHRLSARDSIAGHLIAEFSREITRQPHVHVVNALGFAMAFKLVHGFLYRNFGYATSSATLNQSEQNRVHEYILKNVSERVAVSELARHMAMSRTHLTRRFRATFGMPPLQYALKIRVDYALELVRSGEYRIAEAAYAAGFCDQSHFDRHCQKFYGMPPSAIQRA